MSLKAKILPKITARLGAWQEKHADDPYQFYIIAVGLGVLCGASAAALKWCIGFVRHLVFSVLNFHAGNWAFLLLPIFGIFIAVLYTRLVVKNPMDHATERVKADLADGKVLLSPRLILGSVISCSITLGMGGSAGAESPIAYTGAALGSNMGKAFRFDMGDISRLVGCGAAAGIAGIYMAPIGGVMYAFEVLKMKQNLNTALALTFSSLISALTCYVLLGCHTDVSFVPAMRFDIHLIPFVALLGVMCGVFSVYYSSMISRFGKMYEGISNVWVRAIAGGALLAGLLFLFPSLYGEGYDTIGHLMDEDPTCIITYGPLYGLGAKHFLMLMVLFVVLLLVKPIATAATNESGGVGGDFTPTLFCGGVGGFLFAAVCNHYLGMHLPYALFAFFGMAAVMSGAKKAPLMAIFITAEMTGMYGFILPLTIASIFSMVTTVLLSRACTKKQKN